MAQWVQTLAAKESCPLTFSSAVCVRTRKEDAYILILSGVCYDRQLNKGFKSGFHLNKEDNKYVPWESIHDVQDIQLSE